LEQQAKSTRVFVFGMDGRTQPLIGSEAAHLKLSKNVEYLADNLYTYIISWTEKQDQEKTGRVAELVPKLGNEECAGMGGPFGAKTAPLHANRGHQAGVVGSLRGPIECSALRHG
jgi:hypothetical protein